MSTILTDLNNFAFTSLDDVLVFSETYEDHLHHLNIVFEKFQKAGLKIILSKCQFFKSHLHYLGHRISANNLEVSIILVLLTLTDTLLHVSC